MKNDEVEMEVFRTGDYGPKGAYSETDLDRIVDDYRTDLLEAPLTFDHAQTGPAYGWVNRLRREGDRLVAVLKDVPAAVTELVRKGAYKRRSVELFQKLPHTGRPYLRAVSLLGAATPEVKGLRDVCFASREEACTVEFADGPGCTAETANAAPVSSQNDGSARSFPGPVDAPQAHSQANPASEVSSKIQQQFAERVNVMFAELRRDGFCLAQDEADALVKLACLGTALLDAPNALAVEAAEQAVSFAEDVIENGIATLDGILRRTLLRAPIGEAARDRGNGRSMSPLRPGSVAFSDASACSNRVDPRSLSLHGAALQMMENEAGLAYRDALLQAAQGGNGVSSL